MAFINYLPVEEIPEQFRVDDDDNILRIHSVHPAVLKQHFDLYRQVMHAEGPLSRVEREMIGVVVSSVNSCHY
ncbi:MAG: carboxymuconolactone decarboxylase family protein [Planctomycetota bacterium]